MTTVAPDPPDEMELILDIALRAEQELSKSAAHLVGSEMLGSRLSGLQSHLAKMAREGLPEAHVEYGNARARQLREDGGIAELALLVSQLADFRKPLCFKVRGVPRDGGLEIPVFLAKVLALKMALRRQATLLSSGLHQTAEVPAVFTSMDSVKLMSLTLSLSSDLAALRSIPIPETLQLECGLLLQGSKNEGEFNQLFEILDPALGSTWKEIRAGLVEGRISV